MITIVRDGSSRDLCSSPAGADRSVGAGYAAVCSALIAALLLGSPSRAAADWKEETWTDTNFVPCEGMGITASGTVRVSVGFSKVDGSIVVNDLMLVTRYLHPHQPTARITYVAPGGSKASVNLVPAWFPTIQPDDGSEYLYLPREGSGNTSAAQKPFTMRAGSKLEISSTARFRRDGGNCYSMFDDAMTLP